MVAVFEGRHFARSEKMQFVDPAEILGALQSHQPIQFSPQILTGSSVDIFPDSELMIVNPIVVEDQTQTYDPCTRTGTHGGAWTFATLMTAIAGGDEGKAEGMLNTLLTAWQTSQPVNTYQVLPRPGIGSFSPPAHLLSNWPIDTQNDNLPSLANAPVHLNAIVNRIDLGANTIPAGPGELRFIFGVTASNVTASGTPQPCSDATQLFNIILEYSVPHTFTGSSWAGVWNDLVTNNQPFSSGYLSDLKTTITDQVVQAASCNGGSCLAALRTNEVALEGGNSQNWEQREFHLGTDGSGNPVLQEATVAMTPYAGFNFGAPPCDTGAGLPCIINSDGSKGGTVASYVNANAPTIDRFFGVLPLVQATWPINGGVAFLGGSAYNGGNGHGNATAFWLDNLNANPPDVINDETARIYFSENTCDGCHGAETATLRSSKW